MSDARRLAGRARRAPGRIARRATAARRMLPSFLILGAQKAGTTSLLAHLEEHPRVAPAATKEVHYFDHHAHRPLRWYRSFFPLRHEGMVTGEATPYYLVHPLAPARVAAALPDARLVVLLRDPVERALSHHNHERALGFEPLGLEEALAAEDERLRGEEDRLRRDPRALSHAHQHFGYVDRGRYARQLERWLQHVDRDRLLVVFSEDLFADPLATVHEVQGFLGLERHDPSDLAPRNARSYARPDDDVRRALAARFADDDARLAQLLGRSVPWR